MDYFKTNGGVAHDKLEPISEEMMATNPIARPTNEYSKEIIDKFNASDGEGWIIGRATRDCAAAIW